MKQPDLPMPLAPIRNAPALLACTGSVYRATIVLLIAYWGSGCKPLPTDDVTLAALSRLPISGLRPIKSEVLQAISEISPALDKAHAKAIRGRNNQLKGIIAAHDALQRNRTAKALRAQTELPPLPLPTRSDTPHSDTDRPQTPHQPSHTPQRNTDGQKGHISPGSRSKPVIHSGFTD